MGTCVCFSKEKEPEISYEELTDSMSVQKNNTESNCFYDISDVAEPSLKPLIKTFSELIPLRIEEEVLIAEEDGSYRKGCERLFADGSYAKGEWKGDKLSGKGLLIHIDGSVSIGRFRNNKLHGYGKRTDKSTGTIAEGYWKDDVLNGHGTEERETFKYEGEFHRGKKRGKGVLINSDGSTYDGEFWDDQLCGFGKYQWPDGRTYIGYWKSNKISGSGRFSWPDGRIYEGAYLNDKKNGFGVFYWPSGKRYEGYWSNGIRHGHGVSINSRGESRKEEWSLGKKLKWL